MIFTEDDKIIKVRSIRHMLEGESWDYECFDRIKTPRWKAQLEDTEIQLEERDVDSEEETGVRDVFPREIPIKNGNLIQDGYTASLAGVASFDREEFQVSIIHPYVGPGSESSWRNQNMPERFLKLQIEKIRT